MAHQYKRDTSAKLGARDISQTSFMRREATSTLSFSRPILSPTDAQLDSQTPLDQLLARKLSAMPPGSRAAAKWGAVATVLATDRRRLIDIKRHAGSASPNGSGN